ncbi:MAG: SH3 domain-containing protein [Proteobacteria bacterium]|nr:SH3 domain-containing protein [Pseudomonadota bacterium]
MALFVLPAKKIDFPALSAGRDYGAIVNTVIDTAINPNNANALQGLNEFEVVLFVRDKTPPDAAFVMFVGPDIENPDRKTNANRPVTAAMRRHGGWAILHARVKRSEIAPESESLKVYYLANAKQKSLKPRMVGGFVFARAPVPLDARAKEALKPHADGMAAAAGQYITKSAANVRNRPGTDGNKVRTLKKGERISVIRFEKGGKWARVAKNNRELGFIYGSLLIPDGASLMRNLPAAPVTAAMPKPTTAKAPLSDKKAAKPAAAKATKESAANSIVTRMQTLKKLFDKGLIGKGEYQIKRKALLKEL